MKLGRVLRAWRIHNELELRPVGELFGIRAARAKMLATCADIVREHHRAPSLAERSEG